MTTRARLVTACVTRMPTRPALTFLLAALAIARAVHAHGTKDLFELSLEELVGIEVTTVSRKAERLAETTSAAFVITAEDIRRLGIRTIPEALRLAPGLLVLQIDANKWSVSSRGYGGRFPNKLLVLLDGRLLYTPSFSGVFWDVQDTLIDEIERIEVVRGPGATVWGTNAVNGVINILTRRADAAPGGSVLAGSDVDGGYFAAARTSRRLGDDSAYRAFIKYEEGGPNQDLDGNEAGDDWDLLRAGLRADGRWGAHEATLVLEGYAGAMGHTLPRSAPPGTESTSDVEGAFLVARYARERAPGMRTGAQLTLDYTDRQPGLFGERRHTYSLEAEHRQSFGRHDVVAGALYRHNRYHVTGSSRAALTSAIDADHVVSVFAQDEITLRPDALRLTLGAKLEHNELSPRDIEFMPTARVLWAFDAQHAMWAAATRAVRTPSLLESAVTATFDGAEILGSGPGGAAGPGALPLGDLPVRFTTYPGPGFRSETVDSYELGLRGQFSPALGYDLALFYMDYDHQRTLTPTRLVCEPGGTPVLQNPLCVLAASALSAGLTYSNLGTTETRGLELAVDWQASRDWRLRSAYTFLDREAVESAAADPLPVPLPFSGLDTPRHVLSLRSEYSPRSDLSVALWLRYVDEIASGGIDAYWQGHVNVNWQVSDQWQLMLTGRNLFDDARLEAVSELADVVPTAIERSMFLQARWSF